jgi:hypothetical protein
MFLKCGDYALQEEGAARAEKNNKQARRPAARVTSIAAHRAGRPATYSPILFFGLRRLRAAASKAGASSATVIAAR